LNAFKSASGTRKISFGMVVALVLWLGIVCGATVKMIRYANAPGASDPAPATWPKESGIPHKDRTPTLVMFAHPHCPCTRASLGELERLLAQVPAQLNVHVVFLKPAGTPSDWDKADLWQKAASIPGVTVHRDDREIEARRFKAETSGQTLLYDAAGNLQFEGGITWARGHAGDNSGRTAILQLLREEPSNQVKTPVFGCSLFEAQCQKGETLCKP